MNAQPKTCEACRLKQLICEGNPCQRCDKLNIVCRVVRTRVSSACDACHKDKKKCDDPSLHYICRRCTTKKWKCTRAIQDPNSQPSDQGLMMEKHGGMASVNELVKMDGVVDESITHSLLQVYWKLSGAMLRFGTELQTSDIEQLYFNAPTSIRTDSMISMVYRAMGFIDMANRHYERAKRNAGENLLAVAPTIDTLPAATCLAMASFGSGKAYSNQIMTHCVKSIHPNFIESPTQPLNVLFQATQTIVFDPTTLLIAQHFMIMFDTRFTIKIPNVQTALQTLGGEADRYGPWSFQEWGTTTGEVSTSDAVKRIEEISQTEARLREMRPTAPSAEIFDILFNRFLTMGYGTKACMHFIIGDFIEAQSAALAAISQIESLLGTFWFSSSLLYVASLAEISLQMRDTKLFEKLLSLLEKMAPICLSAGVLVRALRNVANLLQPVPEETLPFVESLPVVFPDEIDWDTGLNPSSWFCE